MSSVSNVFMSLTFRPDIQILRGWAILSVFIYHLRPGWMPAGFLGVDLFFVVSGFLMGAIYDPRKPDATWTFFFNRAKRILPAYFTALLAIVIAAAIIVLPHEFDDVERHAVYAAFLIPNIGYWLDGSYFANATFRPGLHLWSLGVEFQFYLIVPVIVWLFNRRPSFLAALAIFSFVACLAIVATRPRYAFFLLPFRLWEFLIGFYACKLMGVLPGNRSSLLKWLAIPLSLCLIAVMFAPITEANHPKYGAIVATLATAGILAIGLPAAVMTSWPSRAAALIGEYSYSIYLVHFPVIVFWFYRPFAPIGGFIATPLDILAVAAITAILSLILFHVVETPLRKAKSPRLLLRFQAGLVASLLATFAFAGPLQRMLLPKEVVQISEAWSDRGPERCGKFAMLLNVVSKSCVLTEPSQADQPTYLLVGNSHADAIKMAMADSAQQHGAGLMLFRENCVLGAVGCAVDEIADFAASQGVSTIILHASPGHTSVPDVDRLVKIGATKRFKVALIDPIPVWNDNVLLGLYESYMGAKPAWLLQTANNYRAANSDYDHKVSAIGGANFARYSPGAYLCKSECRTISATGRPFYFDAGHLTNTGARELRPLFDQIFAGQ